MNQRTKNRDNVLRSEFNHYSQQNYRNMIARLNVRGLTHGLANSG